MPRFLSYQEIYRKLGFSCAKRMKTLIFGLLPLPETGESEGSCLKLPLGVGGSLAGALEAGFLALFDARIAGQVTGLAQRGMAFWAH